MLHPHHAGEIALIVSKLNQAHGPVTVRRTSLSVGISGQSLERFGNPDGVLYSLSRAGPQLTLREAHALGQLNVNLVSQGLTSQEMVRGTYGVFHLIVREMS
jgi:hypothetical protein